MVEKKIPIQSDSDSSEDSQEDSSTESGEEQGSSSDGEGSMDDETAQALSAAAESSDVLSELSFGSSAGTTGAGATGAGATAEEKKKSSSRDADFSVFGKKKKKAEAEDKGTDRGNESEESSTAAEGLKELQQKYLRALADLENVKKRAQKERSELLKYQGERIFVDLLEVIDNFDRALDASSHYKLSEDGEKLQEGLELIHRMFKQVLEKWNVKGESAVGEPFDPNKHEAISQMPSEEYDPGVVMNELEKAFFYKDKLIRPAKVVVAKEAVQEDSGEQEEAS